MWMSLGERLQSDSEDSFPFLCPYNSPLLSCFTMAACGCGATPEPSALVRDYKGVLLKVQLTHLFNLTQQPNRTEALFCFGFQHRISLCGTGCPRTLCVGNWGSYNLTSGGSRQNWWELIWQQGFSAAGIRGDVACKTGTSEKLVLFQERGPHTFLGTWSEGRGDKGSGTL